MDDNETPTFPHTVTCGACGAPITVTAREYATLGIAPCAACGADGGADLWHARRHGGYDDETLARMAALPEWRAARVTVDDGATVVDAEVRTDVRWNGWAVPRMTRDACETVLAAIAADGPYIVMADGDDYLLFWDEEDDDDALERIAPNADGSYSPGAFAWCWNVVPAPLPPAAGDTSDTGAADRMRII